MDNEEVKKDIAEEEDELIIPVHFDEDYDTEETDETYKESFAKKLIAMSNDDLKVIVDEETVEAVNYADKMSKKRSVARARRWITVALVIVALFLSAMFLFHDYVVDPNGDGVKITQFDGTFVKMYIKVPEEIDGKTVNEIAYGAFYHCGQVRTVSIPATVKKLGSSAFAECHWLRKVTLSEGLEEIGAKCFSGDSELHKITIPESVKVIEKQAFDGITITVTAPHEPEYYGYELDESVTWRLTTDED